MSVEFFISFSLIILVILAIGDLIVGVSNDAVNFLNSAIGSKAASFKTILTVASIGILFGALSSSGMMEITRSGIINPEYFSFYDVLVIFVAVMITDVIIIDAFNTLGIPTSTTVSLIFELFGAAFVVSIFKIIQLNEPLNYLFEFQQNSKTYINWDKTIEIIVSIFLSVFLAFILGNIVQYFSRLLFTFKFKNNIKHIGVFWCAIAITCMSYFLIYNGLKTTYSEVEVSKVEMINYLKNHNLHQKLTSNITIEDGNQIILFELKPSKKNSTEFTYKAFYGNKNIKDFVEHFNVHKVKYISYFFIFWVLIFVLLHNLKVNILKFVILFGTFCLAMAFAGNDLVNFIGVPVTAIQSYELFNTTNSVISAENFLMSGLRFPTQTPYFYFIISALVMILTLWFSKKARNVTETELKLASQEEAEERFSANLFSRILVKISIFITLVLGKIVPNEMKTKINNRFIKDENEQDIHFDLIRATVNLTVASILIAIGTDLKLPLSTTYVTFMVAMGTSVADRAWGTETAVYRISGVLNVIGSWFLTALLAFLGSSFIAVFVILFDSYALFILIGIIIFLLFKSYQKHKIQQQDKTVVENSVQEISLIKKELIVNSTKKIADDLFVMSTIYDLMINGLINNDELLLQKSKMLIKDLKSHYLNARNTIFKVLKNTIYHQDKSAYLFITLNDLMKDNVKSLELMANSINNHLGNSHKSLTEEQLAQIILLNDSTKFFITDLKYIISNHKFDDITSLRETQLNISRKINSLLDEQAHGISLKKYGYKNSNLMFSILLETKDLIINSRRLLTTLTKNDNK